jgi:hypothetical protein
VGDFRGVDPGQAYPGTARHQQGVTVEDPDDVPRGTLTVRGAVGAGAGGEAQANKKGGCGNRPRDSGAAGVDQRPYLLRNLSTRPAVSTIFCLPV